MRNRPDAVPGDGPGATTGARAIPVALTGLRAALAPVVVGLAWFAPHPAAFAACLLVAFLSDVFDGVVARRLGIATPALRRLDSAADTLFYAACVAAAWRLHPSTIVAHGVPLAVLATVEIARHVVDLSKFGREASYHMWSSKLWGIALFVGFCQLLVLGDDGLAVALAIWIGIVADVEGLFISLALRSWRTDVPSLVHAWRLRRTTAPSMTVRPS